VTVSAVVLAAGAARRLGRPKQLEQVGGLPLVARALAAASPAANCLVMLGSGAVLIRPTVQRFAPAAHIHEVPDWNRGMGHVLAEGVRALPPDTDALVVLLADQPFVTAAAVGLLVSTWRRTGEPWLCAGYDGRWGHPHLFAARWFAALATLDGEDGARAVTGGHQPYVVEVPGDDRDIDDESDLVSTGRLTNRHPADVHGARVNRSATDSNPRET
jgi:molybdenum cofactor cytidylyltransferase